MHSFSVARASVRWAAALLVLACSGVAGGALAQPQPGFGAEGGCATSPAELCAVDQPPANDREPAAVPSASGPQTAPIPASREENGTETGLASWYGPGFHRRKTASGERFDMFAMTAAHRTLAFGTLICVRSQITGRTVVVRVNDRGPRARNRVVDLSRAAAIELGLHGLGLKPVEVLPLVEGETSCPPE